MKVKDIESNDVKFRDILRRLELSRNNKPTASQSTMSGSTSLQIYAGDKITEPVVVFPEDWETIVELVKLLIDDRYGQGTHSSSKSI